MDFNVFLATDSDLRGRLICVLYVYYDRDNRRMSKTSVRSRAGSPVITKCERPLYTIKKLYTQNQTLDEYRTL